MYVRNISDRFKVYICTDMVLDLYQIMDTGEAVVDEEDEECDALFTMDDLQDGTADAKHANTEEVSIPSTMPPVAVAKLSCCGLSVV